MTSWAELLQWAMPRVGLRWAAYARVRGQVQKRLARRARQLGLHGAAAYRERLSNDPTEWQVLRLACRVTISRFYRDAVVFDRLGAEVLPRLARAALTRGDRQLRCWSAGCGAGEELYTVRLLWNVLSVGDFAALTLQGVGTDVDLGQLARARRGIYPRGTLRELPPLLRKPLEPHPSGVRVPDALRAGIEWLDQDLTRLVPPGPFDLVLCRNLAFSYFTLELQREVLSRLSTALRPGATVVLGRGETLPDSALSEDRAFDVLSA
jgi:chemotaxis protein methyltransferase CheR